MRPQRRRSIRNWLVQLEVRVADLERRVLELEAQHGYPDTYTGSGFDPDELGIDSEND